MATSALARQGGLFRSRGTKKHRRPTRSARRLLIQEPLESRTVLSAISPVEGLLDADYNADGVVDISDLNTINRWIGPDGGANPYHAAMDLDQDGVLSREDVHELASFLRTTPGDANYDGKFDSSSSSVSALPLRYMTSPISSDSE